jgi:hypothetical protein
MKDKFIEFEKLSIDEKNSVAEINRVFLKPVILT